MHILAISPETSAATIIESEALRLRAQLADCWHNELAAWDAYKTTPRKQRKARQKAKAHFDSAAAQSAEIKARMLGMVELMTSVREAARQR